MARTKKRGPGRPKGSKNKNKAPVAVGGRRSGAGRKSAEAHVAALREIVVNGFIALGLKTEQLVPPPPPKPEKVVAAPVLGPDGLPVVKRGPGRPRKVRPAEQAPVTAAPIPAPQAAQVEQYTGVVTNGAAAVNTEPPVPQPVPVFAAPVPAPLPVLPVTPAPEPVRVAEAQSTPVPVANPWSIPAPVSAAPDFDAQFKQLNAAPEPE